MTEFLVSYFSFLAKAVTLVAVAAAGVVVAGVIMRREQRGESERLEVTNLNRKYDAMTRAVTQAVTPKKALKRYLKAEKQRLKREDRRPEDERRRVYVIDFHGDIRASAVNQLREEITAVLAVARDRDEVVVRLDNAGGLVHDHGLAASQLARLRERGISLTVAVDRIAASGGYLMACVADKILAAPFAIVGSIGVLAQLPNFHRLLDQHGVDFEQIKAGELKRTVTMFGVNTDEDRAKLREQLEETHELFKGYIARYRPKVDLSRVATGEYWHGQQAVELDLIDELTTSDDYLFAAREEADLYRMKYVIKRGLGRRLGQFMQSAMERVLALRA
jgi:serine protease SohB